MVQPGKIRGNQQGLIISPVLHSESAPYPGPVELGEISFVLFRSHRSKAGKHTNC